MDEADARKLFAGERAIALVRVVEHGWTKMVEEGKPRRRRTQANIVWDYTVEAADAEIEPLAGVHRIVRHEIPLYVFDQRAVVRFKKHSRKLLYSNVRTNHQDGIAAQVPMDGLPPENLTCGYKLDQAEAAIEMVVLVRHIRRRVDWFIDLRELAAGVLAPTAPALSLVPPAQAQLPGIRPAAIEEGEKE